MNFLLEGKTALIGGSTQGIGKAIALQLAQNGARVILLARNEIKLLKTLSEFENTEGVTHSYIVADYSDFDNFKNTITAFFENNTVDIIVNNTGGPSAGAVLDKSLDDFQSAFEMHLLANHFLAQQEMERILNKVIAINILMCLLRQILL